MAKRRITIAEKAEAKRQKQLEKQQQKELQKEQAKRLNEQAKRLRKEYSVITANDNSK